MSLFRRILRRPRRASREGRCATQGEWFFLCLFPPARRGIRSSASSGRRASRRGLPETVFRVESSRGIQPPSSPQTSRSRSLADGGHRRFFPRHSQVCRRQSPPSLSRAQGGSSQSCPPFFL